MSPEAASEITFRVARRDDLRAILSLLADDDVARARTGYAEAPTPKLVAAFDEIEHDPNNDLLVGARGDELIATLQLTILPGLSRGGMRRAQVEAVRVRADLRGQRIGKRLMEYAIDRARQRGCGLLQLTTDLRRDDAHRFYLRLGFEASHWGMKRAL
jgi:GNAT superfamily N-acetyltransferase